MKGFATNRKAVLDFPALSFWSNENKTTAAVNDKDAAGTCWGQPPLLQQPGGTTIFRPSQVSKAEQTPSLCLEAPNFASVSETSCVHSWQHHKEPSDSCYITRNLSSSSESGWGTALSRGLLLLKEVGRVGDRDPTPICLHLGSFSSNFSTFFLHEPARNLDNSHCNQCYACVLNANLRAEFKSVCRIPRAPKAINAENKFNLTWKKGLNIYAPNMSSSLHSSVPFIAELFLSTESHPFELGHSLFRKYN